MALKKSLLACAFSGFLLIPVAVNAALPPDAQNMKDLGVMTDFVGTHPVVLRSLKRLDLETYTVHWGDDCIAYFVRDVPEADDDAVPMPGPQPPLVFGRATCPVE